MQVFNSLVSLSDSGNGEVSHRQENDEHDDDSYKYIGLNLFIAITGVTTLVHQFYLIFLF